MIRFDWHGICCIVDFSFFVFAACVGLQCGSLWFCLLLSACFLHELGHLLAMLLFHQKIRSVAVRGVGIVITPVPAYDAYWKDIVIWLAGPAANFVAGLGAFLLGENAYAILYNSAS